MRSTLVGLVALLLAGTWSTPVQAQVPQPLEDVITEWQATFNEGDAEGIAVMYTEDAVRMPPEEELQRGREAIAADVGNYAGISIRLKAMGGLLEGDVAASWGMYELTGTGEDGEVTVVSGRWMNALKMTDDGWKIHRDIWHVGPEGD